MNWEAIGAVGEIVGAVAVVVSLVYLAVQIRQSSAVSKSVAIQNWASTSALEKSAVFSDPEFAALVVRGYADYDSLSEIDQRRFRNFYIQTMNSFELLFFQFRNGTIDAMFFEGKKGSYLQLFNNPGAHQLWDLLAEIHWDKRFRAYLDENKPDPASQ